MFEAMAPRACGYASTPLGRLLVFTAGPDLVGLFFDGHARTPKDLPGDAAPHGLLNEVRDQVGEYFRGDRTRFDLPIRLQGTPFQAAVWSALLDIPYGGTSTYAQIASRIGHPRAARAVGAANGRNPISIIVPCHRLVGADGGLTGYGWGVERKRWLLDLESAGPGCGRPVGVSELRGSGAGE
jgi:methylated-DNA-[protein]-cysteine S-methyltransferase